MYNLYFYNADDKDGSRFVPMPNTGHEVSELAIMMAVNMCGEAIKNIQTKGKQATIEMTEAEGKYVFRVVGGGKVLARYAVDKTPTQ